MLKIDQIGKKYESSLKKASQNDGNQILLDTLEQFANAGGWYLDLQTMEFQALGKMTYKIYGIENLIGENVDYTKFLYDYVVIEDRTIVEQVRMKLISGVSPIPFSHKIIKQDTGEIKQLSSICYAIFNKMDQPIAIRGITMYADGGRNDELVKSGLVVIEDREPE